MPLQLRHSATDDPFYAPHRDVAYITHHLAARAMKQLDLVNWGELRAFFDIYGVKEADLAQGAKVLAEFLNSCTHEVTDSLPQHVLERVGFFKLPLPVRVAVTYAVGQQFLGAFFVSIREVTYKDGLPPVDMDMIVRVADQAADYMNQPAWRRWLRKSLRGVRSAILRLLGVREDPAARLPKGPAPTMPVGPVTPAAAPPAGPPSADPAALPERLPLPGEKPG